MILRTIVRPIIVPHVPYIPHHTSSSDVDYTNVTNVDVPEWVPIIILLGFFLVALLFIIWIFDETR